MPRSRGSRLNTLSSLLPHLIAPNPAHRVGEDRAAVLAAVNAFAVDEFVIVALVLQRRGHLLIRQWPVAELIVDVVGPVLQKDANLLLLSLADDSGIDVAA